jgi:hypothetical protein
MLLTSSLFSHIRKLTAQHDCPMPMIDAAHGHLLTARALHNNQKVKGTAQFGTLDWSAVIAGTRVAAGLDGFDSDKVSDGNHAYEHHTDLICISINASCAMTSCEE